jgi:putative PIG3 family NAD(P)H quinone oxidoreductase
MNSISNIPRDMSYISMQEAGGPEVLNLAVTTTPTPNADEVLIKVAYAGVNRPDVVQRQGLYPPPPGASPILGLEVSGEVVAVGAKVSAFTIGDKVCALANGGGYAEYVTAPIGQCLVVPKGLSMDMAAALPETCFTVWTNVFDRGALQPNETLLIHGGASGIGTSAIQMAKAWGAKVYVTASSDEKCQACLALGADVAINYQKQDFVDVINTDTNGRGVDVILDMVGGDYIQRNITVAAMDGRIVNIAFLRGPQAEVNLLPVMLKRLTLTGSTLRPQSPEAKANIANHLQQHIWPLIEAKTMQPKLAKVFSASEATQAHQLMESHDLIGKVVLAWEK